MVKKGNTGYIFPVPHHEFINIYKGDPIKSFILWLFYSDKFGDELQQNDIAHYCKQQFENTIHGSSPSTVYNILCKLEEEKKYHIIPFIRSKNKGRNKVYSIPNIVDLMLPWSAKLGFGGTILIVGIVTFLSLLFPDMWPETVIFGDNPPVVVYRWFIEPHGLILITALITLWSSIIASSFRSFLNKKK